MESETHSPPVLLESEDGLRAEVARLTRDLQSMSAKHASWQEKVKVGVEQMRQQVIDATVQLLAAEAERLELSRRVAEAEARASAAASPPAHGSGAHLGCVSANAQFATALSRTEECLLTTTDRKIDAFVAAASSSFARVLSDTSAASQSASAAATASDAAASEDLEAYKRRVTTTVKLQSKNCETLQKQVAELTAASAALKATVRERERAVASREETVTLLEQRLDAAERLNRHFEQQQAAAARGPNMDQVNAMEERLEQEVSQVRAEYSARESAIFLQHHDEIERLRAMAEEDTAQGLRESEERLAQALAEAAATAEEEQSRLGSQQQQQSIGPPGGDDAAYGKLLSEFETLEGRLRSLEDQNALLRREAACSRNGAAHAGSAGTSAGPRSARRDPASLQEATAIIAEQHRSLVSLSEQLWAAKKGLLDAQHNKAAAAPGPGSMDAQQIAYLKAIVIKALCDRANDKVLLNLLPVLSTLLAFTSADLEQLYGANPSWISHK